MLEVMFVAVEDEAHAGTREEREQCLHPVGVVMIRPRAEGRVMTEDELPSGRRIGCERLIDPFPVLRIFVEPLAAEEVLFRRVDADELDIASVAEAIEESRIDRRAA